MAGNLVKRQHFVPRTYLRRFSRQKGDEFFISAIPKNADYKKEIFEVNIKNIALEKNFYTLPGETDEQKMAIEKFYSEELEQHYSSIYEILVNPEKTTITDQERELIISTVITMYYRTTKWVSDSNTLMSRVFSNMFELCKQANKDYFLFEGKKISIAGKTLDQFTKEYNEGTQPQKILIQLEAAYKLINLRMRTDSITVVKLQDDDLEYLTSDNPVAASNPNTSHIIPFHPDNLLYLPLDPKNMLILIPGDVEGHENTIFRRTSSGFFGGIEKLTSNFKQKEGSQKFILGTNSSLESYLQTKEITEMPVAEMTEQNRAEWNDFVNQLKRKPE